MAKRKRKTKTDDMKHMNVGWLWNGDKKSPPSSTPSYSYSPSTGVRDIHEHKLVRIVDAGGKTLKEVRTWGNSPSDFEDMKKQYPTEVLGDHKVGLRQVVIVPESHAGLITEVTRTKASPMMCLFTAVEDYCSHILGVKFTEDDRTFFKNHPATQSDGVPFPDTLRVAQELIQPYGLRISRVQLAPNYGVKGDILQWRKVLGINPLAMGDRLTSNAMWREKSPKDTQDYRFEHVKEALYPSVSCGVIYGGESSGVTGSTGGHAVYLPPRRRATGALLSFQIDRAPLVPWKVLPVFPDPVAAEAEKTIEVFDLDGWWKSDFRNRKFSPTTPTNLPVKTETKVEEKKEASTLNAKKPLCYKCQRPPKDRTHDFGFSGICDQCWSAFIAGLNCDRTICAEQTTTPPPHLKLVAFHIKSRALFLQCPVCYRTYRILWDKTDKVGRNMIRAIESYIQLNNLSEYKVHADEGVTTTNDTIPASD